MKPPGWRLVSSIYDGFPTDITDESWSALVRNYFEGSQHLTVFVEDGCVALNPQLLFDNKKKILQGVYCVYLKYNELILQTVKQLLTQGVLNFSIYTGRAVNFVLEDFYRQLCDLVRQSSDLCTSIVNFTIWTEIHCLSLCRFLKSKKLCYETANVHLSLGVYIPRLLFEYIIDEKPWPLFEGDVLRYLSKIHGEEYEKKVVSTNADESVQIKELLRRLIKSTLKTSIKHLIHLRDECHVLHTERDADSMVWPSSVNSPIFPNHLGEVPIACTADVVLQFASFVNMKRSKDTKTGNSETCIAAYDVLKLVIERHVKSVQSMWANIELTIGMFSAVGVIGMEDITLTQSLNFADIRRYVEPLTRNAHNVFPMLGFLPAILWNVSPGCWSNFVLYTIVNRSKNKIIVPSAKLRKLCDQSVVDFNTLTVEDAERLSKNYILDWHKLERPLEFQIAILRNICAQFDSPVSMPIIFTHIDANDFTCMSDFVVFLVKLIIKNATNNCPVLLPEIRSSEYDLHIGRSRKRKIDAVTDGILGCIKRQKIPTSKFVDGFMDAITSTCKQIRSVEKLSISSVSLSLIENLVNLKSEQA